MAFTGYKITLSFKNQLFLNIDFASRIMRRESALEFINSYHTDEEANNAISGLSVFAPYDKQGGRIYKIKSLDLKSTPQSTFVDSKGQKFTF